MKVEGSSGAAAAAAKKRREARRRRAGGGFVVKRARQRVQADVAPTPLQQLFAACRAVFRGPGTVPASADVALVRGILDKMGPEDFDLSAELKFFKAMDAGACQGPPIIIQTTIYSCRKFSIVIFFLPPTAVIPLHNHPGMTVFSKLLLGSLHIKSYDWVDPAVLVGSTPDDRRKLLIVRLANLVLDADFSAPSDTLVLYPEAGGNMHRFAAATPCAILDVLGPPYSADRDCTYYEDLPYSHCPNEVTAGLLHVTDEQRSRLGWLKEMDMPKGLEMDEMPYRGPPIF